MLPRRIDGPAPAPTTDTKRTYARPAWVFNADQVDGLQLPPATPRVDLFRLGILKIER